MRHIVFETGSYANTPIICGVIAARDGYSVLSFQGPVPRAARPVGPAWREGVGAGGQLNGLRQKGGGRAIIRTEQVDDMPPLGERDVRAELEREPVASAVVVVLVPEPEQLAEVAAELAAGLRRGPGVDTGPIVPRIATPARRAARAPASAPAHQIGRAHV